MSRDEVEEDTGPAREEGEVQRVVCMVNIVMVDAHEDTRVLKKSHDSRHVLRGTVCPAVCGHHKI